MRTTVELYFYSFLVAALRWMGQNSQKEAVATQPETFLAHRAFLQIIPHFPPQFFEHSLAFQHSFLILIP
jgi:hypothetical protein